MSLNRFAWHSGNNLMTFFWVAIAHEWLNVTCQWQWLPGIRSPVKRTDMTKLTHYSQGEFAVVQ